MPRRKRANPEQQIQRAVFQHLRIRGVPNMVAFHCPNGGWRTAVEGAIFKGLGVLPGIPDVLIVHKPPGSEFACFYALELKADQSSRPTESQLEAIDRINAAGGFAAIAVGLDAALACLTMWGLLRGTVT
jgi:hypothetical protein